MKPRGVGRRVFGLVLAALMVGVSGALGYLTTVLLSLLVVGLFQLGDPVVTLVAIQGMAVLGGVIGFVLGIFWAAAMLRDDPRR